MTDMPVASMRRLAGEYRQMATEARWTQQETFARQCDDMAEMWESRANRATVLAKHLPQARPEEV